MTHTFKAGSPVNMVGHPNGQGPIPATVVRIAEDGALVVEAEAQHGFEKWDSSVRWPKGEVWWFDSDGTVSDSPMHLEPREPALSYAEIRDRLRAAGHTVPDELPEAVKPDPVMDLWGLLRQCFTPPSYTTLKKTLAETGWTHKDQSDDPSTMEPASH